ncbi:MAG: hypothetical protein HYZ29_21035 [Myxococcales bacterium]|nr:hypothetical protein [Myxococcales bacterium]
MPLHPVIVHIPVALAVLMPLIAGGLLLATWRKWLPARAWAMALALQAVLAIGGFAAMNTGEREEDRVEKVVPEAALEAHEDAGKRFMIGAIAVLALAAVPMFLRRDSLKVAAMGAATAGTLAVVALGYDVGHKGGKLVYVEGATKAYTQDQAPNVQARHHDD